MWLNLLQGCIWSCRTRFSRQTAPQPPKRRATSRSPWRHCCEGPIQSFSVRAIAPALNTFQTWPGSNMYIDMFANCRWLCAVYDQGRPRHSNKCCRSRSKCCRRLQLPAWAKKRRRCCARLCLAPLHRQTVRQSALMAERLRMQRAWLKLHLHLHLPASYLYPASGRRFTCDMLSVSTVDGTSILNESCEDLPAACKLMALAAEV